MKVRYTFGSMLVSQTQTPSTSPTTSFYGYDTHGDIAFLTDANGAVTDTYSYDGWGSLIAHTGSTMNTRLYVGDELDPDVGFVNLRARYFESTKGRFITRDSSLGNPLSPLSLNSYLFANADPVGRKDPSGRATVAEYAIGFAVIAAAIAVEETVRIGNNGRTASLPVSGATVAAGVTSACNFAKGIVAIGTTAALKAELGIYALCATALPDCTKTGAGSDPDGNTYCIYDCGNMGPQNYYTDDIELCPPTKPRRDFSAN